MPGGPPAELPLAEDVNGDKAATLLEMDVREIRRMVRAGGAACRQAG
jgi:hypothetical protein